MPLNSARRAERWGADRRGQLDALPGNEKIMKTFSLRKTFRAMYTKSLPGVKGLPAYAHAKHPGDAHSA